MGGLLKSHSRRAAWSADLLRVFVAAPTIRAAAECWQRESLMGELDKILVAIARSDLRVLKKLVNKGNVNARDEDGFSLLMNAAMDDECDPQVVRLLVHRRANVSAAEEGQQYTALHFAARANGPEIVRILLESAGDATALDAQGNSPLHLCILGKSNLEVVKLLLEYGADPKRKNKEGDSPLLMAKYAEDKALQKVLRETKPIRKRPPAASKAAKSSASAKKGQPVPRKKSPKKEEPAWVGEHRKLWKALVPPRGPAKSLQGELIRLTGRLADEAYRNGNMNWSKGHERAWKFVGRSLRDPALFSKKQLAEIDRHVQWIIDHSDLLPAEGQESPYEMLMERAAQWCLAHPKLIPFKPVRSRYAF